MKKHLMFIFILLILLNLLGCGNESDPSVDNKVLLRTIDQLSKVKSYELVTSRVEIMATEDKQIETQTVTEQKIIFEPYVNLAKTNSIYERIDDQQYRSLNEVYQVLDDDQLNFYLRYSPAENSSTENESVLGEWEKISTVPKEQADWTISAMKSNLNAHLYLLRSNIDSFQLIEHDAAKSKNLLRYDGYLEQDTILEVYKKYIRSFYAKYGMLTETKDMSLEDLKKEIIDGDFLEIKTGIPKLTYSEKPVPVSIWIEKNSFALKKVVVDEALVMQALMEKEIPKDLPDYEVPIVTKALLIYEFRGINHLKKVPMPD